MFTSVLLVCIGNMCRSPIAEAAFKERLPQLTISSAGLEAPHGQFADATSQKAAAEIGMDLSSHRARQFTTQIASEHELILVMETMHLDMIARNYPEVIGKTKRISDISDKLDISDPYMKPIEEHRAARDAILKAVEAWTKILN